MSTGTHTIEFPIRLKETAWDHVYYGTVFIWFEVGRTELSRAAGMPYGEVTKRGVGNFVVEAGARYHRAIPPTGLVRVESTLAQMSKVKFSFLYRIFVPGDIEPRVTGYTVHASADQEGKIARLPDDFLAAFSPTGDEVARSTSRGPERIDWTHELRVRYEETDAFCVVYNGNYFAWMEAAWTMRLMGGPWDVADSMRDGRYFSVIAADCKYVSPLHFDDPVRIEAGVTPVGRTRVRIDYHMLNPETGLTVAYGSTTHAAHERGKPIRVPDELLSGLVDGVRGR